MTSTTNKAAQKKKQSSSGTPDKLQQHLTAVPQLNKTQTFDQQMLQQIQSHKRLSMFNNQQEKFALNCLYQNFEKLPEQDKFQLLLKVLSQPLLVRNSQEINVILYYIQHISMLKKLQKHDKKILEKSAQTIEYQNYQKGEVVFKYGSPADNLYFILQGKVAVLLPKNHQYFKNELENQSSNQQLSLQIQQSSSSETNADQQQQQMLNKISNILLFPDYQFYSNDLLDIQHFFVKGTSTFKYILATVKSENNQFGEMGLLQNSNRNATILAIEDCKVLKIQKKYYQTLFQHIEMTKFTKKMNFLQDCLKFDFRKSELEKITQQFIQKKIKLDKNEPLFKEGDVADKMYLIVKGEIQLTKKYRMKQNLTNRQSLISSVDEVNQVLQSPGKNNNVVRINIGIIGQNELLGVSDLLKQVNRRTISAICLQKTKIYVVEQEILDKLINDVPQLLQVLEKRATSQQDYINEKFDTAIQQQQDPSVPSLFSQKRSILDMKLESQKISNDKPQQQQQLLQPQQCQSISCKDPKDEYYKIDENQQVLDKQMKRIKLSSTKSISYLQNSQSQSPLSKMSSVRHQKQLSQDNTQLQTPVQPEQVSQQYITNKQLQSSNSQEKITFSRNDIKLNLIDNIDIINNSRIRLQTHTDRPIYSSQQRDQHSSNMSIRLKPIQQFQHNSNQHIKNLAIEQNIQPFQQQFWADFEDVRQQLNQNLIKVSNQRQNSPKKVYQNQRKIVQNQTQQFIQQLIRKLYKPGSDKVSKKKMFQQAFCAKKAIISGNQVENTKQYYKQYYVNNLFDNKALQLASKNIQTLTELSLNDQRGNLKTIN